MRFENQFSGQYPVEPDLGNVTLASIGVENPILQYNISLRSEFAGLPWRLIKVTNTDCCGKGKTNKIQWIYKNMRYLHWIVQNLSFSFACVGLINSCVFFSSLKNSGALRCLNYLLRHSKRFFFVLLLHIFQMPYILLRRRRIFFLV